MRIRRGPRFVVALAVLAAAASATSRGSWPWARLSDVPTARPIMVTNPFRIVSDTLQRGETVGALLARHGVNGLDLSRLGEGLRFDPRRLRAGLVFAVRRDATTDEATQIEVRPDDAQRLRFIRTSGGWTGEAVPIRWTTDTIRVAAGIESSLYDALDREVREATLDRAERLRMAYDLAEVNAWSVDFSRDIQTGDRFAAVVERLVSEDGEVRFGRILASELEVSGRRLLAFRHSTGGGKSSFYDQEGKALKRAFLAAPLEFRHISSGISRARFHPVLGRVRKHDGIDYAASTGTPVRASGNGRVLRAGWAGGYGNLVELQHSNGITTRYAHLRNIAPGLRRGMVVQQGQLIGRVGSTGLSSGPHLHYEFRVGGVPRDPRSMKFAAGEPLARSQMAAFEAERDRLLELLGRGRSVADPGVLAD